MWRLFPSQTQAAKILFSMLLAAFAGVFASHLLPPPPSCDFFLERATTLNPPGLAGCLVFHRLLLLCLVLGPAHQLGSPDGL